MASTSPVALDDPTTVALAGPTPPLVNVRVCLSLIVTRPCRGAGCGARRTLNIKPRQREVAGTSGLVERIRHRHQPELGSIRVVGRGATRTGSPSTDATVSPDTRLRLPAPPKQPQRQVNAAASANVNTLWRWSLSLEAARSSSTGASNPGTIRCSSTVERTAGPSRAR